MLLRGVTQGHPFNDGNKRTGRLLAAFYLDVVDVPAPSQFRLEDTVAFSLRVSAGDIRDVDVIARERERFWTGGAEASAGG